MEPLDFLRLVLPSPGHGSYCACELSQRKEHAFGDTVEDLIPHINQWVQAKADAYFALATFREPRRLAIHAVAIKSLFIDMDGYISFKAARSALEAFLERTGLGAFGLPSIVISGGGLHVYWPFEEELPVETWKPIAENFKRLCRQESLAIDMTVTADAARVLRVPGTKNFKPKYGTPRDVRIAHVGQTFNAADLHAAILNKLEDPYQAPAANVIELPGARPAAAAAAAATQMFTNSVTRFKTIMQATLRGDGCAQIAHYVEHAAEDGMEPLWRAVLSIAKVCEDGVKSGLKLSSMHPYPADRHNKKWNEIKGPYSCLKFDSENPGVCGNCKHRGKITNPLALGRETLVDTEPATIEVPPTMDSPVQALVERPEPPWGFAYGDKPGTGVYLMPPPPKGDEPPERPLLVLAFELFVIEQLELSSGHQTLFGVQTRDEFRQIVVPNEALASKDTLLKALLRVGVIPARGAQKAVYDYVLACMTRVATDRAKRIPEHYGWQEDGSFAALGHLFRAGLEPTKLPPIKGLENITRATTLHGSLEQWVPALKLLVAKRMWKQLAVFVAGISGPLMRFTDFAGMTVHAQSRGSGRGKTLTLDLIASVWGNHKHYKTPKSTSALAMQHRLGLLNSLPFLVDEITENTRKDPEWFPNFLLSMTEGKGKDRMEGSANAERLNTVTWSTVAVMTSNTPAEQFLRSQRNHSAEGEMMRLVEVTMEEPLHWNDGERQVMSQALEVSGAVGWKLAQFYVDRGPQALDALVKERAKRVHTAFKFNDDERYWLALTSAMDATLIVLRTAGIIDLPAAPLMKELFEAYTMMRTAAAAVRKSAEDVLEAYILKHYGKMIRVKHNRDMGGIRSLIDGTQRITMENITGRVDIDTTAGWTTFYLPKDALLAHCSAYSYHYEALKRELMLHMENGICEGEKRTTFLADTDARNGGRAWALKVKMRSEAVRVEFDDSPAAEAG